MASNADRKIGNLVDPVTDRDVGGTTSIDRKIFHDFHGQLINVKGFSREIRYAIAALEGLLKNEDAELPEAASIGLSKVIDADLKPCIDYLDKSADELDKKVMLLQGMLKQNAHN